MATKYRVTAYNLDTLVTQVSDFDNSTDRDNWHTDRVADESWGTNDAFGVPLNYTVTDSTWEDYSAGSGLTITDVIPVSANFDIRNGVVFNVATGGVQIVATTPGGVADYWVFGVQVSQNGSVVIDSATPPAKIIQSNNTAWFMYKTGAWEKLTGVAFDSGAVSIEVFDTDTLIPNMLNYVTGSTATTLSFPNPEACEKFATIELVNRCTTGTVVQVSAGGYGPAFYSENNGVDGGSGTHDSIIYVNNGVLWEQKQRVVSQIGGGGGAPVMSVDASQMGSFTAVENTIYELSALMSNATITMPTGANGDKIVFKLTFNMTAYSATIDSTVLNRAGQSVTFEKVASGWIKTSEVAEPELRDGGTLTLSDYVRAGFQYKINISSSANFDLSAVDVLQAGDTIKIINLSASSANAMFDSAGLNHATAPGETSVYTSASGSWKLLSSTVVGGGGASVMTADDAQTGSFTAVENVIYNLGGLSSDATVTFPTGAVGDRMVFMLVNYAGYKVILPDGFKLTRQLQAASYERDNYGWNRVGSTSDNTFLNGGTVTGATNNARSGYKYIMDGTSGTVNLDTSNADNEIVDGDLILITNLISSTYTAMFNSSGIARIINAGETVLFAFDGTSWSVLATNKKANTVLFSQTADGTVANTASIGDIDSTGVGSSTILPDFFTVGKTLRISGKGHHSSIANPDLTFEVGIGTSINMSTGAVGTKNSVQEFFDFEVIATCRSVGVTGTVMCQGVYRESNGEMFGMSYPTAFTVDTTVAMSVDISVTWSVADPDNSITLTNLIIESLN